MSKTPNMFATVERWIGPHAQYDHFHSPQFGELWAPW